MNGVETNNAIGYLTRTTDLVSVITCRTDTVDSSLTELSLNSTLFLKKKLKLRRDFKGKIQHISHGCGHCNSTDLANVALSTSVVQILEKED